MTKATETEWIDLILAACEIDSRTEKGALGTTAVAQLLGAKLEPLGFTLQWSDPAPAEGPRGRHLHAVRNPKAAKRILLLGHTDTVLSPEEVPIRLDPAMGRMSGAGTCDMKGGCVLMIAAVAQALKASAAVAEAGIDILLNCSEEISGPSFRDVLRPIATGAQACLSFEPARPGPNGIHRIVESRKGGHRFHLRVTGRSAHSGVDHAYGINAVRELARKIELLESLTDYARELTVNVGVISGGQAGNQVPDLAEAHFELRAYDTEIIDSACAEVRRICAAPTVRSARDGETTRLTLTDSPTYPAWHQNVDSSALAQRYITLARNHELTVESIRSGGGADASLVADLTPTLDGLGILGGNLHQPDEWAEVRSFGLRTTLAAELIASVLKP